MGQHVSAFKICLSLTSAWSLVSLLDVYIHVFHQIWEVFNHYFFKYYSISFSLFSSGLPMMHILVYLMVLQRSLRVCSFSFNLFPFCSSGLMYSIVLFSSSLILSSACLNLPMNPFSEFFISVLVVFSSRTSF